VSDAQVGAEVPNFILPPALAGRVWEYLRVIQIAPASEKLDTWTRTAQLIAGLTGPDFRANGDRHMYAARTRFIPNAILTQFEQFAWPPAVGEADSSATRSARSVDIGTRLKQMWR
jgi:hypothetical protein